MTDKICFVTGNSTKVLHAQVALEEFGIKVISQKVDLIEPRAENPEEVAREKAIQAFSKLNQPLMVEDSGIFISALNGFPKTFVHLVMDTIGVNGIVKLMEGVMSRSVEFRQSLAYIEPGMDQTQIFSYVDGGYTIADEVWKSTEANGYAGFDQILIPPGENKPLCTFSSDWRAKRDAESNKGNIHYHQLAHWLNNRKTNTS